MVNKKWILIAVALCAALVLTGCMSAARPEATYTPAPMPTLNPMTPATVPEVTTQPIGNSIFNWGTGIGTIQTQIEQISEIATDVIVVDGSRAVVGVTFAPEYRGALTDRIVNMIVDKIKAADSNVTKVRVTDEPARITTAKDLAAKVVAGADITTEFDALYSKIG